MSRATLEKTMDMLTIKKTPEIYPMTSIQETFEYIHDKLNETSAWLERLEAKMHSLTASLHTSQQKVHDPGAPAPAPAPDPAPEPAPVPEPRSEDVLDAEPERPFVQALHFRRFSDQEIESVPVHIRRPSEPRLESVHEPDTQPENDPDSEHDVSPCLWQRLTAKFEPRQELASEPAQEPDVEPQTPKRAQASRHGLKRLSLCMMPPDEMHDILAAISPDIASLRQSPLAPAPSPAINADTQATSLFLR